MYKKIENFSSKNNKESDPINKKGGSKFLDKKIIIKISKNERKRTSGPDKKTKNKNGGPEISTKELIEKLIAANKKIEQFKLEAFDPLLEFQKLVSYPKEKRKENYQKFKEKLYTQRYGWAQCQTLIEHFIENDPDIDKNLLLKVVELYKNHYGFCEWQIKKAGEILNYYYQYRQNAKELLKEYTDKLALVRDLTNINFPDEERKNIDVSLGLMSVDILTNNENALKIYYQTENPIAINIKDFNSLGFTRPPQFKDGEVLYTVINLSKQPDFNRDGFATKIHEWQHLKNAIFEKVFLISCSEINKKVILDLYKEETFKNPQNLELRTTLLKLYFKRQQQMVLNRVKDEIFAYIEKIPLKILNQKIISNLFIGDNPSYDFIKKIFNKQFEDDELYQNLFHQFFIKDYPNIIKNASCAFVELANFIHNEKGEKVKAVEKACAFLIDKPLINWPNIVRRFIDGQKK